MSKWCVLFLVVLCLYVSVSPSTGVPVGTKCERVFGAPTCVCKTEAGVIDLTKIASFDGTPRFTGLKDPNDFLYEYNPCAPFDDEKCQNVHICQTIFSDLKFDIAAFGTEEMYIDEHGKPYIHYTSNADQFREVFVSLNCDPSVKEPVVTTTGDSKIIFTYEFTVTSCHACPGGCTEDELVKPEYEVQAKRKMLLKRA